MPWIKQLSALKHIGSVKHLRIIADSPNALQHYSSENTKKMTLQAQGKFGLLPFYKSNLVIIYIVAHSMEVSFDAPCVKGS